MEALLGLVFVVVGLASLLIVIWALVTLGEIRAELRALNDIMEQHTGIQVKRPGRVLLSGPPAPPPTGGPPPDPPALRPG